VVLDATGFNPTMSGGNSVRIFYVAPGASLTATNLVLTNGSYIKNDSTALTNADGGAIYIDSGTVNMTGCMLANNNVQSIVLARGGAILTTEAP